MTAASLLVMAAQIYGMVGIAMAAAFLVIGIDRVDPAARGSLIFRPLLVPGLVLLWPLVLWRWTVLERTGSGEG